jgi:hypothetical protein
MPHTTARNGDDETALSDGVLANRGVVDTFAQFAHVDDTLYVVACFVEFVGQRSRDVFVKQKRHLHDYDSGRSSGPVTIPGSSSAAS